ncbi:MAG: acyl--CoA ligase [Pseudomonas sp.]|jgi:acyl-CoA synthetase (AMP-forming)/AMP-acid ligase II|nr:acyl--CoA ligase [Pseudomonas sp.]MDD2222018.1 class I adenylate-forming enzyme family protein [Pseudomonas sp.]MDY0414843.1 class I adenylate-forming enzyme family protein [Pseudomonas sp.]NLO53817.1 acyl--CoA ligase [Gammaproteobacteria bacterium]
MSSEQISAWRKAWAQLTHEASPFAIVKGEKGIPEFSKAPLRLVDALQAGREYGEKPFVRWQGQSYTYHEFYLKTDKITAALQKDLSIGKGDRVAIAMRNRPAWMISCMAAVQAGAIPVPINSWSTSEELLYAIKDCAARVVFCDPQRYALLQDLSDDITVIVVDDAPLRAGDRSWQSMLSHAPEEAVLATPAPHDPALILYTSGTTGQAKGVLSSNKAVCQALYALDFQGALAYMTSAERVLPLLESGLQPTMLLAYPMFHVSGLLAQFMSALRSGRRLVIIYKWDVDDAINTIRDEKITQFAGVPTMMQQLIHNERFASSDTDTLFALGLGGSAASRALLDKLLESKPMALSGNGYGMTESNGICSAQGGNQFVAFPESVGWPLPLVQVVIGESPDQSAPTGTPGPIWLRTSALMDGYWNKPEETAKVMQDGWFFTGDVGYLDANGMLYITDRIKDIIIRGGENISAVEVEHCICEHPDVEEAAVFMLPDADFGETVGMVVHTRVPVSQDDLLAFMAQRLAAYKLPERMWFADKALPRSATGKILKAQVKKEFSGL